jgi:serine phosphatase RsbU (regulator of sigma subunit)
VQFVVSLTEIQSAKILVVDDQEANVRLLEGMLRVAGYTSVESTMDPRAVCELYRRHRHSLILLDLQMPGMDGFQVLEDLREIEGIGYLPVLVITAQPGHKLRALEAGAKDFVSKPFDMAELKARVHNLLEVRLLNQKARNYSTALEETIRELEISREVIRLKTLEEQRRSEAELSLAQETQESLLPRSLPRFENFEIHAYNSPTRYVGGDFYDFLRMDAGAWAGVLADVSGKGISAALLSSMVLGALNMELRSGTTPQESLNRINTLLCEKSLPFQFVTLFLFVLGPDGDGQFISAAHNVAYLFRSATGKIECLTPDAFPLGMFDDAVYESRPLRLDMGDILVVYSDGFTDAQNQQEDMFGEDALRKVICETAPRGSLVLKEALLQAIENFTQGSPQTDDITLLVIERATS